MRDFEEEDFFPEDRKRNKKIRKIQRATDKSKYKKTDQKKQKEIKVAQKDLKAGQILAITGETALVLIEGKPLECTLKGVLKKEKTREKNLIAVGDFVRVQLQGEDQGVIAQVEERFSYLARSDASGRKQQLIAVNIDLAFITISVVKPPLKPSLVDRYMISAERGNIQPIVLINKIDLLKNASDKDKELFEEFVSAYEEAGIQILSISAKTRKGLGLLKKSMKNKSSVFSGQSGVGKSSILNSALGLDLKVGKLIEKALKGKHTTTKAELIPLKEGGFCVDTPGIRSFGIYNLQKDEIIKHFHEIAKTARKCKYPNCSHLKEPSCAVQKAVDDKKISRLRFESYRSLIKDNL